ncbi:hypothetical protein ACSU1N_02880 [Thermogladius sp. 4427co]
MYKLSPGLAKTVLTISRHVGGADASRSISATPSTGGCVVEGILI